MHTTTTAADRFGRASAWRATPVLLLAGVACVVVAMTCGGCSGPDTAADAPVVENTPAPPPPPTPKRRQVLCVGIDRFADGEIPPNLTAAGDAVAMADLLGRAAPGTEVRTTVLVDGQATREAIGAAVSDMAARSSERFDDTLLVFVATHGAAARLPGGPKSPVGPTRLFLVATDTESLQWRDTGFPVSAFSELWQCDAERVVVLLDCAFGSRSRSVTHSAVDPAHVRNVLREFDEAIRNEEHPARALVLGAGINEPIHLDSRGRSTFAAALLEGLLGEADGDADGVVQLRELVGFLGTRTGDTVSPIRVVADLSAGSIETGLVGDGASAGASGADGLAGPDSD